MLINKKRAYRLMEKHGIEAIIASTPENVTYVTDFWSLSHWTIKGTPTYAVLPLEEKTKPFIVTPISELDLAVNQENCWVKDFRTFGTFYVESSKEAVLSEKEQRLRNLRSSTKKKEDATSALIEGLMESGLNRKRIAIDEMNITPSVYESIHKQLPEADIIDGYSILRQIRAVKTSEEIERLERSAEIIEKAFMKAIGIIREGVTELEISDLLHRTVTEEGGLPDLTSIGAGRNSAFTAAIPSDYRVKMGDIIRFDIGCIYKHYYSDTARIAVLGKPSDKQRSFYDAVKAGEDRALDLIHPGTRVSEIFEETVKRVREAGIPHYRRNHVGHGIGIECYDLPSITHKSDDILEAGMVLNLETPYYELGFGGVQVEDTVLVTEDGYRLLTKSDRNLYIL
jgi:Xaa-Pro aminopeptidase